MRWNGIIDRFGPGRLLRYGAINNKLKLRESLTRVMQWDFDRVVMSHGRILETGGRAKMSQAFGFLTPAQSG